MGIPRPNFKKRNKLVRKHTGRWRRPPETKRFCEGCEKERNFRYNRNIGHSECICCGWRKINFN